MPETNATISKRPRRSLADRLAEAKARSDAAEQLLQQRKNEIKALERAAAKVDRKERTHRLILLGAAVENALGLQKAKEVDVFVAALQDVRTTDGESPLISAAMMVQAFRERLA